MQFKYLIVRYELEVCFVSKSLALESRRAVQTVLFCFLLVLLLMPEINTEEAVSAGMQDNWQANPVAGSHGGGWVYRRICPNRLRNQRKVGGQTAGSLCVCVCACMCVCAFACVRKCLSFSCSMYILYLVFRYVRYFNTHSYDLHKVLICRISVNNM